MVWSKVKPPLDVHPELQPAPLSYILVSISWPGTAVAPHLMAPVWLGCFQQDHQELWQPPLALQVSPGYPLLTCAAPLPLKDLGSCLTGKPHLLPTPQ